MADEVTAPTDEQIAAAKESADALVASSVADLVVLIEGADLLTLQYALAAEQAKGDAARKGAIAALEAAVAGHPENAAEAAAEADAPGPEAETPVVDADAAPATGEATMTIGAQVSDPAITEATEEALATAAIAIQPTVDGEPHGDPITATVTTDAPLDRAIETVAETLPVEEPAAPVASEIDEVEEPLEPDATFGAGDLEDEPAPPDALSVAPARPHQSLVDQLDMRWNEMLDFIRHLEGEVEGELGDVLAFARSKL